MSYDLAIMCAEDTNENDEAKKQLREICARFEIDELMFSSETDLKELIEGLPFDIEIEEPEAGSATGPCEFASLSLRQRHSPDAGSIYEELVKFCRDWDMEIFNPQYDEFIDLNNPGSVPPGY